MESSSVEGFDVWRWEVTAASVGVKKQSQEEQADANRFPAKSM